MGRTKAPLHLEPMEPIHFRVGNYAVIGLGHSVSLALTGGKNIAIFLLPFWAIMAYFTLNIIFCQRFVAIHHAEDRCGFNCCADCRYFRQDGTSVVTDIVGYRNSCSALLGDSRFY